MATCKNCQALIPDGMEYCSNCEKNNRNKADESYLDDLLNSVIFDAPPTRSINRDNDKPHETESDIPNNQEEMNFDELTEQSFQFESQDVNDNYSSDLNNIDFSDNSDDLFDLPTNSTSSEYDIFSSNDDFLNNVFDDDNGINKTFDDDNGTNKNLDNDVTNYDIPNTNADYSNETSLSDMSESDLENVLDFSNNDINKTEPENVLDNPPPEIDEIINSFSEDMQLEVPEMEDFQIPDIGLVNNDSFDSGNDFSENEASSDLDIMNFDAFNQINGDLSNEEPSFNDDLGSFFNQEDSYKNEDELENSFDVGKLVDSIESGDFDKELQELIPEEEKKPKKKKKRKNIFTKIFGNVREDLTLEELEAREAKEIQQKEDQKKQAEEKKKQAEKTKEELKKQKEDAAAQKKAEADKAKKEKEAQAKLKKEQAAQDAQKKKEERLALLQAEQNPGKINKIGASILLVFFGILVAFILIGTDLYSYKVSIDSAATNFSRQRYNEAYKDVYGLEIKDDDILLYDQIMTVMYVNKQLNSYNNFIKLDMKAQALDSLIKGLSRYEKYIDLAKKLSIEKDMNIVRKRILSELGNTFKIDESIAMSMLEIDEQPDYTVELYSLIK